MSLLATIAENILRAAMREEYGLVVRVTAATSTGEPLPSPALRGRAVLYHYRREGGPEMADIQIRLSPTDPDNELWIINRSGATETEDTIDIESI